MASSRGHVGLLALLGALACGGRGSGSTGPAPPDVLTQVAFVVQPGNAPGAQTLAPAIQVAIEDSAGHVVTTATNRVTLTIGNNPSGGTLSGPATVAAVNGVATFSSLSIDKAGSGYTLVASTNGLTGATSTKFNITVGAPAKLTFTTQPANGVAGQAVTPPVQVAIEDAGGNVVQGATNAVTVKLGANPAGGTLSGTLSANPTNGLASFASLTLNRAGSGYVLAASSATLTPATSTSFAITPGPSSQLVFTGQPTTVVAGRTMAPAVAVTVEDVLGNVETPYVGSITLALGANPGHGTLSGTLTAPVLNGVASFSKLAVDTQDTGYTLIATAGPLKATSTSFIVGTTGISYVGGPIIYAPRVAAIYWSRGVIYRGGPPPGTSGRPAADHSLIAYFLRNLGGSSYFNIMTTYFDSANTPVQNAVTYSQYWADSAAPPAAPADGAIQAEIERGFASGALTYDANTLYAVFTGTGVNLGGNFGTEYCAYHSYFIDGSGRNVKYAAMPYDADYPISAFTSGCSVMQYVGSPNSDTAADAEVNTLSHELAETVTDENINAWYTFHGDTLDEVADLCNFNFGSAYTTGNGALANESFGQKNFLVQMLWVDMETTQGTPVGCQQSWTTPVGVERGHPRHEVMAMAARWRPGPAPSVRRIMRLSRGQITQR